MCILSDMKEYWEREEAFYKQLLEDIKSGKIKVEEIIY